VPARQRFAVEQKLPSLRFLSGRQSIHRLAEGRRRRQQKRDCREPQVLSRHRHALSLETIDHATSQPSRCKPLASSERILRQNDGVLRERRRIE
jgi:hypothetical protein